MPITFIANREVRTVPKGWRHPKDAAGRFVPSRTREAYADLLSELEPDEPRPRLAPMPSVEGLPPEKTRIAAYETTTEGTPISPTFPDTPAGRLALVNFCARSCPTFADHRADAETWAAILFGECLAGVSPDGSVTFA